MKKCDQSLSVLVKEDVLNPEEFILSLKNDILPSCQFYKNSIVINQIREFSKILRQLAEKHHVPPLTAFSDDLAGYADLFDITHIEKKIQELPLFIERLIQRL